jgi:hypothetical protein
VSVRVVWTVGTKRGWPPEVYVLFAAKREAQRHAASAAYIFDVLPLAVYGSYDDCPTALKLTDSSAADREPTEVPRTGASARWRRSKRSGDLV